MEYKEVKRAIAATRKRRWGMHWTERVMWTLVAITTLMLAVLGVFVFGATQL